MNQLPNLAKQTTGPTTTSNPPQFKLPLHCTTTNMGSTTMAKHPIPPTA